MVEQLKIAASELGASVQPRHLRRPIYPSVAGWAMLQAAKFVVRRWDHALANVEQVQQAALLDTVARAKDTEFGRQHDFAGIRSYADFAKRVPVGNYDTFSPYIERMRKGERGLICPEFIRYFGNSSGSSREGRSKFLPVGARQIRHTQGSGADVVMRYLAHANEAHYLNRFTLALLPPTTMKPDGPVLITSNPALMVTKLPPFAKPIYLPGPELWEVSDYNQKMRLIAETYMDHDVGALTGTTCWFPVLFETVLQVAAERGRRANGIADIWPNLRVMIGGGVSAEPYLPVLRRLMGRNDFTLVDTYNATEGGIYAASDFSGEPGMLMLPHRGTFFEFVPLDERESPAPTRVPLWQVQLGQPYSIVVTTTSGLFAYELGDIVRFTSTQPPRVEFMGRTQGCLSVTQELTTHVEIERAVAHAISEIQCQTVDFGAAAEIGVNGSGKSRYVLYVEFAEGAAPANLQDFAAAFDTGLCAANRVYREHRGGNAAILAPRVVALQTGGARRYLEAVTRGNVQGKFPRIFDASREAKLAPFLQLDSRLSGANAGQGVSPFLVKQDG